MDGTVTQARHPSRVSQDQRECGDTGLHAAIPFHGERGGRHGKGHQIPHKLLSSVFPEGGGPLSARK